MKKELEYKKGDLVRNQSTHPHQVGEIIDVDKSKACPYLVKFIGRPAIWHPEAELTPAKHSDIYG